VGADEWDRSKRWVYMRDAVTSRVVVAMTIVVTLVV